MLEELAAYAGLPMSVIISSCSFTMYDNSRNTVFVTRYHDYIVDTIIMS